MRFEDWGLVEYEEALERQRAAFERVIEGGEEVVVFCEHPPVFTIGKNGDEANILARGAQVVRTDRGGDVTFHGPGQLVCYPILRLGEMGLREYVHRLEQAVIDTLAEFGIEGVRTEKGAGVWVRELRVKSEELRVGTGCEGWRAETSRTGEVPQRGRSQKVRRGDRFRELSVAKEARPEHLGRRVGQDGREVEQRQPDSAVGAKICAVGVRASRGAVMHGLALNVTTDLEWFRMINPCGMAGEPVAKMDAEMEEVKATLSRKLREWLMVNG